ncbi:hypothetical protein NXU96_08160 [Phocaeicola vulgatus]|nr:hypothetical protein [Phocaeicola vulgatus]
MFRNILMAWGWNTTTIISVLPSAYKWDEKLTCPLMVSLSCITFNSGIYSGVCLWKMI